MIQIIASQGLNSNQSLPRSLKLGILDRVLVIDLVIESAFQ
ncbi:MAG: hypothetical protein RID53_04105 [Coleofasciculus sp. B1-GNL1-01]